MDKAYFLTSKRFWVNFLTIVLGVYGVVTGTFPVDPKIGALVLGIINLILAQISDKPLGYSRK